MRHNAVDILYEIVVYNIRVVPFFSANNAGGIRGDVRGEGGDAVFRHAMVRGDTSETSCAANGAVGRLGHG